MQTWYLDTSAAVKLILRESESPALMKAVRESRPNLVSSVLLETELRRAVLRNSEVPISAASDLISSIGLFEMDATVYRQAGLIPGSHLRSLDAIHLTCAMLADATFLVSYDSRLLSAAAELGVPTLAPGRD